MPTMQQLQLAELIAEEHNKSQQFSLTYIMFREQFGIRESMNMALKTVGLMEVFQDFVK